MRKFLITLLMVVGFLQAQTPIIRLMQSREYKTPKYWWRDQETFKLRGYLADDTTGMNTANAASGVAYKNNNFDAWRDSVMTVAVTLDDNGASVTAFRLDLIFDNDLITWDNTTLTGHDSTRVEKGAYIAGWTEGDSSAGAHYSYEVTWYNNVGYNDSLAAAGSEISTSNNRYDWLRITMVSHNGGVKTFGNGNGTQVELLKLHFKIDDVVDNFAALPFRVATKYNGSTGYYTYVTNGNYATAYKVYIDGNVGTEEDGVGNARGDITLHPKLLDIEGYLRYAQGKDRALGAAWSAPAENTYPYWKVKFELDHNEANFNPRISNWLNVETITDHTGANTAAKKKDETTTDDVIGNHTATFYYDNKSTTALQALPKEGFLGISYYDSTYTDDKGYYSIQLPRNNRYRMSFWPPDASDNIEAHTQLELDRTAITNANDAIASFNFQSGKHKNYNAGGGRIDTLTAIEYLIGDVDGDDLYQLNDTYILWSYVSGIFNNYTHHNGNSYEDWATIEVFKESGNANNYVYYQTVNGQSRPQKYEFTVYWDETTTAESGTGGDRSSGNNAGKKSPMATTRALATNQKALSFGQIETTNPLMDDHQTGLDTLHLILGGGYSSWSAARTSEKNDQAGNPDYLMPDIGYYFTGDINNTGTKVTEPGNGKDGYQDDIASNIMFHRWKGGSAPTRHANKINTDNDEVSFNSSQGITSDDFDNGVAVVLSLPADSTVRVQSGNQIEVPLTITPRDGVLLAGFEFELEYKEDELEFVDMKTDVLPGPWMTYVNVHEAVDGWRKVSFGGVDYSPNNKPETYWIDKEITGLNLLFEANFPDSEWTTAPIRFTGKYSAGTPAGRDLLMKRKDGQVLVWNKYWAFGGGKPDNDEITYNYPNPFIDNTTFQFYLEESKDVKLYILNSIGQKVGTLLNENVLAGLHTFEFTNTPTVWLPEVSVYENHKTLEPGVYIFVMQTDNKIKANKFTVVK